MIPSPCTQQQPSESVWQPRTVRIRSVIQETADTRTYELEFLDQRVADAYRFRPGQFNMLYLPGAGEAAISMSGDPEAARPLMHTVRAVGRVTNALASLQVGDTLGLRGPFGSAWPLEQLQDQNVIIIAGGIGLAPLRPVLYEILNHRDRYKDAALLYGARTPDGMLYPQDYSLWVDRGLTVETTVDRADSRWSGRVGVVTLLLEQYAVKDPANTHVLICGPEVMMKYVAISAHQRGIPKEQIWVSLERNMNCAVGFCGHCQLGPEFICKDGPVFALPRVAPLLDVKGL